MFMKHLGAVVMSIIEKNQKNKPNKKPQLNEKPPPQQTHKQAYNSVFGV